MKGSALVIFMVIVCIMIALGMLSYIVIVSINHSQIFSSNVSASVTPSISVRDFAPSLPMSQKTTILIQLSDSSEEKYIVPTGQVATYIKSLPEGYHVVSKTP